ncbi:MAG TPA: SAF domain-containing protein [Acidimicrobiales bacterium]|nr:SAF domain-containing protein [Acidimicrobiales bacterium]
MAQQTGTVARAGAPDRGTDRGNRPAHTVRRRRGLPGSRAVVGGLLVAAAAVGLFAAASRGTAGPAHAYVVARHELAAGARLQASDLTVAPMELTPELRARAFESTQPLVGATLVAPLGAGELVQVSAVVARVGDAASRELSFTLERGRVGAGIKLGERADLLATYGTGNDAFTQVVVRQALLVGIDRPRTTAGDSGPATVTVSVDDPNDALALAHAIQLGKITLVRATGAPPLPSVPGTYKVAKS